jgi:uncharacterized protein
MHNYPAILKAILEGFALRARGTHGITHWARVQANGLRIAEANGADREVVILFALFHDSRRVNEGGDRDHGLRGGEFARSLRGELIHLDDERFERLFEACRRHTHGPTDEDPTLLACWDADRLDLGRVGIDPDPWRLGTPAARNLREWATARAVSRYEPQDVLAAWGAT